MADEVETLGEDPERVVLSRTFTREEVALVLATQACTDEGLHPATLAGGQYLVDIDRPITVVLVRPEEVGGG